MYISLPETLQFLQKAVSFGFRIEGYEYIKKHIPNCFWEPRQSSKRDYIRLISIINHNNVALDNPCLSHCDEVWMPIHSASSEICAEHQVFHPNQFWEEFNTEYMIAILPEIATVLHGKNITYRLSLRIELTYNFNSKYKIIFPPFGIIPHCGSFIGKASFIFARIRRFICRARISF